MGSLSRETLKEYLKFIRDIAEKWDWINGHCMSDQAAVAMGTVAPDLRGSSGCLIATIKSYMAKNRQV